MALEGSQSIRQERRIVQGVRRSQGQLVIASTCRRALQFHLEMGIITHDYGAIDR